MGNITLIEASAGSGKTHRLTLEYLNVLLTHYFKNKNPKNLFSSVLAITFTNKAAWEMRVRILKYLKAIAFDKNESLTRDRSIALNTLSEISSLVKSAYKSDNREINRIQEIETAAGEILKNLFVYYSDFNVRTIDSLMTAIIHVLIPELGIPPDTTVDIDYKNELENSLDEYLDYLANDSKKWEILKALLERINYSYDSSRNDIENILKEKLKNFFNTSLQHDITIDKSLSDNITEKDIEESFDKFKEALKTLYQFIKDNKEHFKANKLTPAAIKTMETIVNDISYSRKHVFDLAEKAIFASRQLENLDNFILKHSKGIDGLLDNWEYFWKKTHLALSDLLERESIYMATDVAFLFTDFLKYWHERPQHVLYVSELSRHIRELFRKWSTVPKDTLPYPDAAIPYPYLKLADRFTTFLFDEFQDTSELQFKALAPLVEEVFSSYEDASMLLVGDKKQAIYAWRGGKAELMDPAVLKQDFPPAAFHDLQTDNLDINFRSKEEIVSFNNRFWAPENISSVSDDPLIGRAIFSNFKTSRQTISFSDSKAKGYVNVTRIISKEIELLHEKIKQEIVRYSNAGYERGDIAVLLRRNDEIKEIVNFLEANNIETVTDESLSLSSSSIINEIIAFMKFVQFPPDDLNFTTFITGEVFNSVTLREKIDITIFKNKKRPLYKFFRNNFKELWDRYIDYFFRSSGLLPAYDMFQDFCTLFDVYEKFPDQIAFLLKLAEIIHMYEEAGISSLSSFLDTWDSEGQFGFNYSIEPGETKNSVHVITMHKAKGLEFPVVIVPLRKRKTHHETYFIHEGKMYYITEKPYAKISGKLKSILDENKKQEFIAELNLLYVAFTRAKDILSVPILMETTGNGSLDLPIFVLNNSFIKSQKPVKKSPSNDTSEVAEETLFESGNVESIDADSKYENNTVQEEIKKITIGKDIHYGRKKMLTSELEKHYLVFRIDEIELEKEQAEHGEILHRMLSNLEVYNSENDFLSHLNYLMQAFKLNKKESDNILSFFERNDVKRFFIGQFIFHNERDIADLTPQGEVAVNRIDRYIERYQGLQNEGLQNSQIEILDYKFGKPEPEHMKQIKKYRTLLGNIYPKTLIKCFLLYINENRVEEI